MSLQHGQLIAVAITLLACGKQPSGEPPKLEPTSLVAIGGGDWVLVALGTQTIPADSARRPTLRLDTGTLQASGFAGCNRYSGSFSARAESVAFGPLVSTKMFCAATSELENAFLKALGETATYRVSDSELVLRTREGQEARFKPASQ